MSEEIRKAILEKNAERKLNILKGFKELDILSKGHMDFGSGTPPRGNSKLTQKKITDKRGHQTTRWVKPEEEEKQKEQPKQEEQGGSDNKNMSGAEVKEETNASEGNKSPEDWVNETPTEELLKYMKSGDDPDLIHLAEEELMDRGEHPEAQETDGESEENQRGEIKLFEGEENAEYIAEQIGGTVEDDGEYFYVLDKDGNKVLEDEYGDADLSIYGESGETQGSEEPYQTPPGESLNAFYSMPEEGQRAVLEMSMKHNVSLPAALDMYNTSNESKNQANEVIDQAIESLQNLKEGGEEEQYGDGEEPDSEESDELFDPYKNGAMGNLEDNFDPKIVKQNFEDFKNFMESKNEDIEDMHEIKLHDEFMDFLQKEDPNKESQENTDSSESLEKEYNKLESDLKHLKRIGQGDSEEAMEIEDKLGNIEAEIDDMYEPLYMNAKSENSTSQEGGNSSVELKPISENTRRAFADAPQDTLVFENEYFTALYSPGDKFLEISYNENTVEEGDYDQYEDIEDEEEAKGQIEEILRIQKENNS